MAVESMQLEGIVDWRVAPARADVAIPSEEPPSGETSVAEPHPQRGPDSDPCAHDERYGMCSMAVSSPRNVEQAAVAPLEPLGDTPGSAPHSRNEGGGAASLGQAKPMEAKEASQGLVGVAVPDQPQPGATQARVAHGEQPEVSVAPGTTVAPLGPQCAPATDFPAGRELSANGTLPLHSPVDGVGPATQGLPQRPGASEATAEQVQLRTANAPPRPPEAPGAPKPSLVSPAAMSDSGTGVVPAPKCWRNGARLAACLACDICADVLRDPVVSTECMHSFCRQCIDNSMESGEMNCPTCSKEGKHTMLGQRAFLDRRLQLDHILWDMIRKIFPRPELELEIEKHKMQGRHAAAALLAVTKGQVGKGNRKNGKGKAPQRGQRAEREQQRVEDVVVVFLSQMDCSINKMPLLQEEIMAMGRVTVRRLDYPYLRLPRSMPVSALCRFTEQRLKLAEGQKIQILAGTTQLAPALTMQMVWDMHKDKLCHTLDFVLHLVFRVT